MITLKDLIDKYSNELWNTRPYCQFRNRSVELAKEELLHEIITDLRELEKVN